ncbi:Inosine/uridine-preferring nucleoside hydrolase domain-containing protein [Pavlovales sp. CCMP2436]|nr:Inosine/uridine-preferring nucleoside hydrolase domain-containing protein [Pavlovales sp. CCMP2436]
MSALGRCSRAHVVGCVCLAIIIVACGTCIFVALLAHRRPATTCPARVPLILGTDVDVDDIQAISYLLQSDVYDIKAIVVENDGWSSQWDNVVNVMRLTQRFGKPKTPVVYGPTAGETLLNNNYLNAGLPPTRYLPNSFLIDYVPLPFEVRPPAWQSAAQIINEILAVNAGCTTLIALGPLTSFAAALHRDADVFRRGVRSLVISGGSFAGNASTLLEAQQAAIAAALTNPAGGFPFGQPDDSSSSGEFRGGSWNIYADPHAASEVLASGLQGVVFVSSGAQKNLPTAADQQSFIPSGVDCPAANFSVAALEQAPVSSGQSFADIFWWDESAAVVAEQLERTRGGSKGTRPPDVCTNWVDAKVLVDLRNGGTFSWTEVSPFGASARICLDASLTAFLVAYWPVAAGCRL